MKKAMAILGFLVLTASLLFIINKGTSQINASQNRKAAIHTEYYKDISSLSFPVFSDLKEEDAQLANDAVKLHLKNSYKEFQKIVKDAEKKDKDEENVYETSYKVKYNEEGKLSFLIYDYQFSGGAHGMYTVTSYNFDFDKHKQVVLTDVLNNQAKIEKAKNYIFSYINEHPEQFYSDLKKSDIRLDEQTAFYYTSSGISIVFQQYDIAPYAAGNQEIKLPSTLLY
ncbi:MULTISPECIES: DUF3298 and DUF4163 domain-containing protein [Bacillus]|uniref:DUF3298 and DUF4163 domain-containing protein n=1 Tax=Bacillus TaxID=1386 RepID=UPI0011A185DF|nr:MULTISPECIES: DUF3298 and DUF4163 domain-containing protein [Bacillus]MCJ2148815.1 DUF3298 and DUF4163 domain-containing protein [Bacillus sp. B19-2]MDN5388361.1 DUF3298 and DUF4163 domain-containing protein [Bacillus sp. LB7]MEC1023286.1 DUF3298 and DUF4163 domain-containing protein [Bacillus paralicheniformis]MEC1026241.1 DUF3298 and DUF4163 domain-containing protein [Bacillus paralicheniformis]MEC1035730.1 DUF3298 and DUF4163 domain-containing protein [Bacillus paralicheniformis]